jgi:integrase
MRGHVRKRGKRWSIVYDEGTDPETGRRRQRWLSGFATKREAEDALTRTLRELKTQEYVTPASVTFRSFVAETWEPHLRETRRASTVSMYLRSLRLHILPVIGNVPVQQITAVHVDRVLLQAQQEREDGKPRLSQSSRKVTLAIVSAALEHARKKKLVRVNVCDDADVPKVPRRKGNVWTVSETKRFLQHVEGDELEALWSLYALLGLRRGEGVGLRWQDVDLENGHVTVAQQIVPVDGELVLCDPKTEEGQRTLPVDDQTVELLRNHCDRQRDVRELYGTDYLDGDLVFCRPDGRPLDPRGISQRFQTLRKAAELPPIRLHDLRHGVGTMNVEHGTHVEIVRRQLGHASIRTTIDLYARHEIEDAQRAAVEGIAEKLRPSR